MVLPMRRVVVISDHAVLAELLGAALAGQDDLDVIAIGASVGEVSVGGPDHSSPDVVVVALADRGLDADVTNDVRVRWPDSALVMVAAQTPGMSEVTAAVLGSAGSLTVMSSSLVAHARDRMRSSEPRSAAVVYPQLSEREREVLQGLSRGSSPAEIARTLGISLNTCRGYLRTLMAKLGARSQREVLAFVARYGLPVAGS